MSNWKNKRMHFIHEQNSGISLINGNLKLIKDALRLKEKFKEGELEEFLERCIQRCDAGVNKIKESRDYIYNEVKEL